MALRPPCQGRQFRGSQWPDGWPGQSSLSKLESQWVGPQHSWGLLQPFPVSVVVTTRVLRIGLDSQEVGSAASTVAGVFVRGPGLFSGLSCVDGIGYVSKHQPARPLQWALGRERALQGDRQEHQKP